jgi:DNA-directed RNA polymerase subunit H (RpoH/RPB5)
MGEHETLEEKRAAIIVKYRGLKVDKVDREGEKIIYFLSRGDKRYVLMCVIGQKTIGISYVRELKEMVDKEGAAKGIMVGSGKYTYSSKSTAEQLGLELVQPNLPAFDVFEHELVPRHEILTVEEREEVLKRFHAEPYQFPWIKSTDPISIILGAEPGDIVRVTGESETAGIYESYRYVVK